MSEKEQQFERIYKETENFGRTQFVREIQMQINDNKKKDKEIERLSKMLINRDKELLKFDDELKEKGKEIERLNNIIGEAIDRAIHIQKTFGYVLDDLIYLLMQGSDKE